MRHRRDRAEDLFLADRHVGLHAVEDRRTDEVAARMLLDLGRPAIEQERGAVFTAGLDVGEHALFVPGRDDRTHVDVGLEPVAQSQAFRGRQ